jgi:hypothetical protein
MSNLSCKRVPVDDSDGAVEGRVRAPGEQAMRACRDRATKRPTGAQLTGGEMGKLLTA